MCVILVVDTKRPSKDWVDKAWERNSHGGGVAWREDGFVRWEKGLSLKDMHTYAKELPFPHVLHFRIASVGSKSEYLCHPFEASRNANYKLSGKTKNPVVFHNGTWAGWRHSTLNAMITVRGKVPTGPWSDTRAMALMVHHFGGGALEMINEKAVFFSPDEMEVYGDGWEEENDILMSNQLFLPKFSGSNRAGYTVIQGYSGGSQTNASPANTGGTSPAGNQHLTDARYPNHSQKETVHVISQSERASGGPSLGISFRGSIAVVGAGKDLQEPLEEDQEQILEGAGGHSSQVRPGLTRAEERIIKEWASAQNPKTFSGQTPIEAHQHARRVDMSQLGIEYIGRM